MSRYPLAEKLDGSRVGLDAVALPGIEPFSSAIQPVTLSLYRVGSAGDKTWEEEKQEKRKLKGKEGRRGRKKRRVRSRKTR
jgi:hypothetical protein